MIVCVCLPGIMENSANCHIKIREFYYQISVGTLCMSVTESREYNDEDARTSGVALHVSMVIMYVCDRV